MTIPRGRVFATDGGARWGVCNTPLHGYPHQQTNGAQPPTNQHQTGHRPEWMDAGYDPPRTGSFGRAYAIRPYPAGRRAFGYPANFAGVRRRTRPNLAGVPDAPGQIRRCPQTPRGKCRETCAACANATANAERPRAACANATANAERLAPPAQTPRQTPRDLRSLRKRHGKRRETCAACANATANAARLARPAQTPRQTPRDLRSLRTASLNTEQPLTVKILAYDKKQDIDAYRRHHQRD